MFREELDRRRPALAEERGQSSDSRVILIPAAMMKWRA